MITRIFTSVCCLLLLAACSYAQQRINAPQLLSDIKYLSSDELEGRYVGSAGSKKARTFIEKRFQTIGLKPFIGKNYEMPFSFRHKKSNAEIQGANVAGYVKGTSNPEAYIVVTAHYDHLKPKGDSIYNGADDNASGTAGVMALAAYFVKNPAKHSIIFVAFDAEEVGHKGAEAFVNHSSLDKKQVKINVNVDMISRNEKDELYAVGTYYHPFLKPYVERASKNTKLNIRFGHDSPEYQDADNWTFSSDHAAFHNAKIPYLYFGVEDHPDYHHPTDEYKNIDPAFYIRAVEFVIDVVQELDKMPETTP
jgi:Zn-dependent M28 family amino/carboxypeptidase